MHRRKLRFLTMLLASVAAVGMMIPATGQAGATNGRGIARTYWSRSAIGPCAQLQCIYQAPFNMFGRLKVGGRTFAGAFTIDSPGVQSLVQQWPAVAMHGRDRLGHRLEGICNVYLTVPGAESDYSLDCAGSIDGAPHTAVWITLQVFQDPAGILNENGVFPGVWVA